MAKKRLQKKREAAKTSAFQAAAAKAETPKITTKKIHKIQHKKHHTKLTNLLIKQFKISTPNYPITKFTNKK